MRQLKKIWCSDCLCQYLLFAAFNSFSADKIHCKDLHIICIQKGDSEMCLGHAFGDATIRQ